MSLAGCVKYLADLAQPGKDYSAPRVDACVDDYLIRNCTPWETRTKRLELAQAFGDIAPESELADRIRRRILRQDAV